MNAPWATLRSRSRSLREALAIDHPAVLGVCLSGSGPSIVALAVPGREQEAAAERAAPVIIERENTA